MIELTQKQTQRLVAGLLMDTYGFTKDEATQAVREHRGVIETGIRVNANLPAMADRIVVAIRSGWNES